MFGTLRFILSIMVALSHLGVLHPNFNQGVFAVVLFYMLAGMVSYKLISSKFQNQPIFYYKNRIKRIFPLYFFALFIALVAYFLGASSYFISKEPTLADWLSNTLIIPLAYYMFTNQDTFTLLPPVWSLGVELQFYLIAPFLFTRQKLFFFIFSISLFIFILASVGILDTNLFGYRIIVGVLFIFLLGSLIYKAKNGNSDSFKIILSIYVILLLTLAYIHIAGYKALYNYETITAMLVGIPLLLYFKKTIRQDFDSYLGSLSYGVFLLHFPSLWLTQIYFKNDISIYTIILLTLLLSHIGEVIIKTHKKRNS